LFYGRRFKGEGEEDIDSGIRKSLRTGSVRDVNWVRMGICVERGREVMGVRFLANQAVIVAVRSDPEPDDAIRDCDTESTITESDAHRAKLADLFEMEGRVIWVELQ
jgi:hypothetical protein